MGKFDEMLTKEATAATTNEGGKKNKPKAKCWLNVGTHMENPETGELVFVSLPLGIAVDTQTPSERGTNSWIVQQQNLLLKYLQKCMSGFEPGETDYPEGLQIELRRMREADEVDVEKTEEVFAGLGIGSKRRRS